MPEPRCDLGISNFRNILRSNILGIFLVEILDFVPGEYARWHVKSLGFLIFRIFKIFLNSDIVEVELVEFCMPPLYFPHSPDTTKTRIIAAEGEWAELPREKNDREKIADRSFLSVRRSFA